MHETCDLDLNILYNYSQYVRIVLRRFRLDGD